MSVDSNYRAFNKSPDSVTDTSMICWCWKETKNYMSTHDESDVHGDPSDCWIRYDQESARKLEAAYKHNKQGGCFLMGGEYHVDFKNWVQTKQSSKFPREVQRVTITTNDLDRKPPAISRTPTLGPPPRGIDLPLPGYPRSQTVPSAASPPWVPNTVRGRPRSFGCLPGQVGATVSSLTDATLRLLPEFKDQVRPAPPHATLVAPIAVNVVALPPFDHAADTTRKLALVVNDVPQDSSQVVAMLRGRYGWNVVTTDSTQSALTMLHYGMTKPDVVISDMGRMEENQIQNHTAGKDLLEEVRKFCPALPFVIHTTPDNVERYEMDVSAFNETAIVYSNEDVIAAVERFLPGSI